MRRTPLLRGAPLSRTTRLKQRRATPRKSGRVLWPEYLTAVRALPCFVCGTRYRVEADHQGPRPYGRKADDDTAVPMCGGPGGCHQLRTDGMIRCQYEDGSWGHARLAKGAMRDWCDAAIAATRAVVLPTLAPRAEVPQ